MIPYTMSDVYSESAKEKFTVVSTFAGGGGSSTGYRLAGGKILLVNEFVDEAVKTYQANYPDTPVEQIDIRHITRRKYVEEWFAQYGIKKGGYDILDGSPPCSAFSVAGSMHGSKIDAKNIKYSDTKQDRIGYLIHDFVYIALVTQPKCIVLENVPEIAKQVVDDDGIFNYAVERLRRHGYLCAHKVLNATDYGVAQGRRRLFLIALRPDIADAVGLPTEKDVAGLFPKKSSELKTLRDVLTGVEPSLREKDMLLSTTRKSSRYEMVKILPHNPSKVIRLRDFISKEDWSSDFSLERWCWDKPARTVTQMGVQLGRPNYYHPDEDRPFTINELKRIMAMPDDFVLTGSYNQKAERLGRMVPPLMTMEIAKSLYENVISKL